jgi:hypothetical protein
VAKSPITIPTNFRQWNCSQLEHDQMKEGPLKPGMKLLKSSACAMGIILSSAPTFAADNISGQVVGAGAPIVGSTVTLWAEGSGAPRQLAQARTGADGRLAPTAASR